MRKVQESVYDKVDYFLFFFVALSLSIIFIYTSVVFAVQQIPTQKKMSCTEI